MVFQQVNFYQQIYCLVRLIPKGNIVSYGMIAAALGAANKARVVGYALHRLNPETKIPWHRVINAKGRISIRGDNVRAIVQKQRLMLEGIIFDSCDTASFERFGYKFTSRDLTVCTKTRTLSPQNKSL